jgi:hypothetical protein
MSSAVIETELYESQVIGPDGGDPRTAGSVRDGLQDLANRTKWLKARVDGYYGTGTNKITLLAGASSTPTGVNRWDHDTTLGVWTTVGTGASNLVLFGDSIPDGVTITQVDVWLSPPVDGVVPATRPAIALFSRLQTSASATNHGSITDPNSSAGAYEVRHMVSLTGLSVVVSKSTRSYYVTVSSESGANAQAGLLCYGAIINFTPTG